MLCVIVSPEWWTDQEMIVVMCRHDIEYELYLVVVRDEGWVVMNDTNVCDICFKFKTLSSVFA